MIYINGYINILKSKPPFLFCWYYDENDNTNTENLVDGYNICISVLQCYIKEKLSSDCVWKSEAAVLLF